MPLVSRSATALGRMLLVGSLTAAGALAEPPPPPASAANSPDPVQERAEALKEAGGLLDKAAAARTRGNKSYAEQLFSSAELIVGPEALAELAPLFRQGGPPRVTTPTRLVPKEPAQPVAVGSSDADEPDPRPPKGSLSGTLLIDGKTGEGMGVVTLEPASGKFRRRAPRQRIMEQRDRQFAPRMLVVPVGSTVTFPNFDAVYHNVFSTSELKPFDLGIYKNGQARDVVFDKEGVFALGCNLHSNMSAHIVVGAPHYAIAGGDGKFAFRSLDPGSYKLRAWSERSLHPVTREVVIKPDRNTISVDVKGDAPAGPLPDKFGKARASKSSIALGIGGLAAGAAIMVVGGARGDGEKATAAAADRRSVEGVARDLDGALREAAAAMHSRAATLAELPRLQAAVSTDAATVRDLTQEELMFKPKPGETIDIGQVKVGGAIESLFHTSAGDAPSPPLDHDGYRLQIANTKLYLSDVMQVKPKERESELHGVIALSLPDDTAPAALALDGLHATGELRAGGQALTVGTGRPDPAAPAQEIDVALSSEPGKDAHLVVRIVAAAPTGAGAGARAGLAALCALAGLIGAALLWRRKPAAAGEPPAGSAGGSARATGIAGAPNAGTGTAAPNAGTGTAAPNAGTSIGTGAPVAGIGGGAPNAASEAAGGSATADATPHIGRYAILRELGAGGMADVYLARSTGEAGFEKLVALKVMQAHLTKQPAIVEHFLDEARLASRLVHPNIVQIYDLGRAGKDYFIAMEYVDGSDLERLLGGCRARHEMVPLRVAFTLVRRVCDGLDAAHNATAADGKPLELVHRDVKSANVFVARTGAVKVGDFGIAKANQESRVNKTEIGQAKGTAAFMAPEHRMGQAVDRRADVYAVGAVAYEVFTGDAVNLDLIRIGHLGQEGWPHLKKPSEVRPELPPELDEVLFKAMAYDRDNRYATCAALEEALEAIATKHNLSASDKHVAQWIASALDGTALPAEGINTSTAR